MSLAHGLVFVQVRSLSYVCGVRKIMPAQACNQYVEVCLYFGEIFGNGVTTMIAYLLFKCVCVCACMRLFYTSICACACACERAVSNSIENVSQMCHCKH
jgi:hypothetical protein